MKATRLDIGDLVVITSDEWETLKGQTGTIVNVLEGGVNKYVVELENGERFLLWEHEIKKV